MPVPALFRYRKRVSSRPVQRGTAPGCQGRQPRSKSRPVYPCLVRVTRSSNQGPRESGLSVADGVGAVLAAAPSIVAPVQGAGGIPDPRGVCGLVLFEAPHVSPPAAWRRVPFLPLRVSSAGMPSPACKPQESLRSSLGALLPPFRLVTRREGGRYRSLPSCTEDFVSGKVQQGIGPGYVPTPCKARCEPYKAWTVVLLLHIRRAEFHRRALRSTRLALIHNQSLWNASETQRLRMKPD